MKAKITRLGETIELEGTAEELERFIKPATPSINIQTLPYTPWMPVDIMPFVITNPAIQPCAHEYPNPWMSVTAPSCKKCGASAAAYPWSTQVLCTNNIADVN